MHKKSFLFFFFYIDLLGVTNINVYFLPLRASAQRARLSAPYIKPSRWENNSVWEILVNTFPYWPLLGQHAIGKTDIADFL